MPRMNGVELARRIREEHPSKKIIGISGCDGGSILQEEGNFDVFIKKPFDGEVLLAAIRQVLDGENKSGKLP